MKEFILLALASAVLPLAALELKIEKDCAAVIPSPRTADWKSAKLIPGMTIGPKGKQTELAFKNGKTSTGELDWSITAKKRNHLIEVTSEIVNKTDKELWIEPELRLAFTGSSFRNFWDGFNVVKNIEKAPLLRRTTKSKFEKNVGLADQCYGFGQNISQQCC